jgi:hypothetical protein
MYDGKIVLKWTINKCSKGVDWTTGSKVMNHHVP